MKCLNGIQQFVLMALYRATKFIIATKEVGSEHHEWKTQNGPDACLCQMSKFHHQISISNELLRMCTLCVRLFFSTLLQWIFIYAKTFQLFNFKTGLDGEVCSSDFNVQNGNSVGAGRCLWLAYFTYYHIVRLASFLRWFHLWRVDSSPAFCLVQWHTDTQHRKDMLHKSVAAEKETYVKNYVKFINTRCSVSSQEQTLRRELRIRSASCSGVFLTNFEVIMRYCVDCLIWLLQQNDFKRRN